MKLTDCDIQRWLRKRGKPGLCLAALFLALSSYAALAQDFTVNLKDTDIQELIKFVAEVTDTTIVVDPGVKGKVRVVSNKPIARAELYDLFLSILDVHGFTAVRSGNVVRVIQSKDARSASLPVDRENASRVSDEYVTQVIRLENISASKLIPVLRPLVPQQAHMAAYAPSNAIIMSDTAANIRRITEVIQRMDTSATQETDVVPLKHAVAGDVVSMLEKLNRPEQGSEGPEPEVLLVPDTRTNSVLVTGDELQRARISALIAYLDTPLEQTGNVRVVYLDYANAQAVAEVLSRVMQNLSQSSQSDAGGAAGRRGAASIEADEDTNSLIITAEPDQMAAMQAVIRRLDIRRAQVLVEAIIVEMEINDGADLGLQWLFANETGAFGSNVDTSDPRAGRIAGAIVPPGGGEAGGIQTGDFNVGSLAAALAQSSGLSLGWGAVDEELSMTVILNALESQTNANILSTPSLLTLDNQEAFITVGQNVPFITGSFTNTGAGGQGAQNPFQTIQRENVGITLTVKPHVNDGDSVVLDIEQEVSSLTGLEATDLITNERKIQTKVLAGDGRIVVLGGLIKDDVQDRMQKVPLLGDIPLLGRLFRNESAQVVKTNLLIFIRPTIIRDDGRMNDATGEKYRYIRDQQMQRRERGLLRLDDNKLPVLPEWEEQIRELEELREDAAAEEPRETP
ncbi:MAG: type II secretion system secretin GspD [Chromatocurvus sp.]